MRRSRRCRLHQRNHGSRFASKGVLQHNPSDSGPQSRASGPKSANDECPLTVWRLVEAPGTLLSFFHSASSYSISDSSHFNSSWSCRRAWTRAFPQKSENEPCGLIETVCELSLVRI